MGFLLTLKSGATAFLMKSTNSLKCFFIEFFLMKMTLKALEGVSKIRSSEKSAFYETSDHRRIPWTFYLIKFNPFIQALKSWSVV